LALSPEQLSNSMKQQAQSMRRAVVIGVLSIDAIAWNRDGLASTLRAAAWARQTPAVSKNKIAILTACRVQDELPCLIARDGLHDVGQMLLDLSLGNTEHLRQLVGR
jgi:hypothetical protein